MSAWNNLKGSLFAAGRDVSQKAKEVSGVAKLKMDIRSKEDFVEKQYAILGRAYYEVNKDNVDEKEEEQFRVITEAIEEIARMNQQVLDIQGVVQCPGCGKKVPADHTFCSDCGARLDDIIVEATVVEEETAEEQEEPVAGQEENLQEEEASAESEEVLDEEQPEKPVAEAVDAEAVTEE